jgi:hypothetical protein
MLEFKNFVLTLYPYAEDSSTLCSRSMYINVPSSTVCSRSIYINVPCCKFLLFIVEFLMFLPCTSVCISYVMVFLTLVFKDFTLHRNIDCESIICLYFRNVSQDLSETILTMVGNCSILLSKPRQPPPGVLRHRGMEPGFNPTSLGGQVYILFSKELTSSVHFLIFIVF